MRALMFVPLTMLVWFGPAITLFAQASKNSTPAAAAPPAAVSNRPKHKPAVTLVDEQIPVTEATKIEPQLIYRMASLAPVKRSVYHKEAHVDFADQIYVILRFTRTYDYMHEVVLEPAFRTVRNNPASWDKEHVAEQAYVQSAIKPWLSVTAGKKAEFTGSGFFVNPSDLLNENKDVFDPLYQREGVVFSRVQARRGDFSLGLGFIPERGLAAKAGKPWLTLSGLIADADLKVQATHQESEKTTVGLSAQRFFGSAFELHTDSRYQARQRGQHEGNVGPSKYSAYAGDNVEIATDDEASGFYLAGSRYIFTHQRTLVMEYIQNQSGLLPDDFGRYFSDLREATKKDKRSVENPPTETLGRHYVFLGYQDDAIVKSTHISINGLQNTDDKSAFVAMIARYHLSPITSIELAPTFFKGDIDSEFGEMPFANVTYLVFKGRF